jgi:hypothetical protein
MSPSVRSPEQRDRRFARARFITQAILLGSLTTSVLYVGYAANLAHSATTTPVAVATTPTTTTPAVTTIHYGDDVEAGDSQSSATSVTPTTTAPKTSYTTPTTAPVTTTTVCTTTPSGRMVCH